MKFRDLANVTLDRLTRMGLAMRLGFQAGIRLTHGYQPNPFVSSLQPDPRDCQGRFDAAMTILENMERPSVLDLGCNQGYFTFRFAHKGGICLGIDNDRSELMVARARAELHKIRNAAFLELTLDPDNLPSLPKSDIVVCLSIFHHWVRHFGQETACDMLSILATRAEKAMVFDSGQPEEKATSWATELNFMQPDGATWIAQYLRHIGFEKVHTMGLFPTSLSPIPRTLFVACRA